MKPNGEYVTADDGVRLFVQRMGDGPDALIIPNRVYMVDAFAQLANRRTVIFCDPRNRGYSDRATEPAKVEKGIHHDVDDVEAIRRHYSIDRVSLLAHSYLATVLALYAMKTVRATGRSWFPALVWFVLLQLITRQEPVIHSPVVRDSLLHLLAKIGLKSSSRFLLLFLRDR